MPDIIYAVGEQFGANGVEIDAHMLCAEDHIPYQGLQYSNEEFEDIQDSLDRPFGEWNCRHSWHPIILGISPRNYTHEQLEEMKTYSRERIEIDGRTKTRYEWSQEMRRVETAIRQQKDTANLAKASGDKTLSDRCRANVLRLNKYYQRLSDSSGLETQFNRTYVPGYKDVKSTYALTYASNSGTMEVSVGGRRNEEPLTPGQIEECRQIAIEYGMPPERIVFVEDMYTSYLPYGDRLYISTDVYPCGNTDRANYMISCRGTIAHELIGHRKLMCRIDRRKLSVMKRRKRVCVQLS